MAANSIKILEWVWLMKEEYDSCTNNLLVGVALSKHANSSEHEFMQTDKKA